MSVTQSDNNYAAYHCFVFLSILAVVLCPGLQAGPEGENVVRGEASFQRSGDTTTVRASDGSIIEYSDFDIASQELVRFIQPSSSARSLNRVIGGSATDIYGQLQANGIVYLTNPAGIYFHSGSVVDVAGIYAAAGNISNEDFINGVDRFTNLTGDVKNWGTIDAEMAHLIGRNVSNFGTINAPEGTVTMLSGEDVLVGEMDGHIYAKFSGATRTNDGDTAAVSNEGTIDAEDGQVALGAGDMIGLAVHNGGGIEGKNVEMTADGGDVVNEGTIDATGETGGDVVMAGRRVGQLGSVSADGLTGDGGSIDIYAEDVIALGSGSVTTANAGTNGDGGEVIAFSPDTALFRSGALVEARGGSEAGDGGFVEVSGLNHVEVLGDVSASAPNGAAGTFLIDPTDITIDDVGGDIGDDGDGTFTCKADSNTILDTTIEGYLDAGTSVTLDTSDADVGGPYAGHGDITQTADAPIGKTAGGNATLTLIAQRNIDLNSGITSSSNQLSVDLQATGTVDVDAAVTTNGGQFDSTGTDFDNTATITTTGGAVDIQNTGVITIGADINTGASNITIAGSDSVLGGSAPTSITEDGSQPHLTTTGVLTLDAAGNIGEAGENFDVKGGGMSLGIASGGGVYIDHDGGNLNVDNAGTLSGSVDLQTFDGDITINDSLTVSNDLTLTSDDAVVESGFVVTTTAGDLNITGTNGGIGRSGNRLDVSVTGGDLILTTDGNVADIYVTSASDLSLGAVTTSDTYNNTVEIYTSGSAELDINSVSDIVDDLDLNAAGDILVNSNFDAGSMDIDAVGSVTTGGGTLTTTNAGSGALLDIYASGIGTSGTPLPVEVRSGSNLILTSDTNDVFVTSASVLNLGAVTTTGGDVSVTTTGSGSNNLNLYGSIGTAGGGLTLTADGYLGQSNGATINTGAGAIEMTTDSIFLNDTIAGTGTILLQPETAGTGIGIGDGAAGGFDLDAAEIVLLQDGFSGITIGRADGTGAVDIQSITFNDPVTIQSPDGAGSITANGQITGAGDASVTLDGPGATTTLNSDIVTAGNAITISDSVLIGDAGGVTLDTTNGGAVGAGNDISITGTTDSTVGNEFDLTLDGGTSGDISLAGAVGASDKIDAILIEEAKDTIFGSTLEANTVTQSVGTGDTQFAGTVTLEGAGGMELTTNGQIELDDELTATAGDVLLDSDTMVRLGGDIQTSGGNITIHGTSYLEQNCTMTTQSGGGDIDIDSVTSSNHAAKEITLDAGDGSVEVGAIGTGWRTISDVNITGKGGVTLNGDIDTAYASSGNVGDVSVTGPATIADGGISIDTVDHTDDDGSVSFSSTIDDVSADPLTINTGSSSNSDVDLSGGTVTVGKLDIKEANDVTLARVETDGAGAAGGIHIGSSFPVNSLTLKKSYFTNGSADAGSIVFNSSDISVEQDGAILRTNGTSSDGDIHIGGPLDPGTEELDLSLNPGAGTITFDNDVGTNKLFGELQIVGDGSAGVLQLEGGVNVKSSGDLDLNGVSDLQLMDTGSETNVIESTQSNLFLPNVVDASTGTPSLTLKADRNVNLKQIVMDNGTGQILSVTSSSGDIDLSDALTVNDGRILLDTPDIISADGNQVTANRLSVDSGSGGVDFSGNNSVDIMAADVNGDLDFANTGDLAVSSVSGINGINTNGGDLDVEVTGGHLYLDGEPIHVGTGTVDISVTDGLYAEPDIVADKLVLRGGNEFFLKDVRKHIGTLAADVDGPIVLTSHNLSIGTVGNVSGVSADSLYVWATGYDLNIDSPVDVGDAFYVEGADQVSQSAGSTITADILQLNQVGSSDGITLTASNRVGSLNASNIEGRMEFSNDADLSVGETTIAYSITTPDPGSTEYNFESYMKGLESADEYVGLSVSEGNQLNILDTIDSGSADMALSGDVVTADGLTLAGETITVDGTLSPGGDDSAGTLKVGGFIGGFDVDSNLTLADGSTLFMTLNGLNDHDLVDVNGAMDIGDGVQLSGKAPNRIAPGKTIEIVDTQGSVNGRFDVSDDEVVIDGQTFSVDYGSVFLERISGSGSSDDLAGATPRPGFAPALKQNVLPVSNPVQTTLMADMDLFLRPMTPEEIRNLLMGFARYNDADQMKNVGALGLSRPRVNRGRGEYRITRARLSRRAVEEAARIYSELFWTGDGDDSEYRGPALTATISRVVADYRAASNTGEIDEAAFWKWLDGESGHGEAKNVLRKLHTLLERMRITGMNEAEYTAVSGALLDQVIGDDSGVSRADFRTIIQMAGRAE